MKIKMYHIYNYDAVNRIRFLNSLPYTYAGYLPEKIKSNVSTDICGDKINISTWFENDVRTIRITDAEIAKSYADYFKYLWKNAIKKV